MKILGEKSLSSKVVVSLNVVFTVISIIDIVVLSIIAKIIKHIVMNENVLSNVLDLSIYIMIIITGIIALFIIYQFIKIFKNLKNNVLFCNDNSKRLNIVSNSCFFISLVYFIITIFTVIIIQNLIGNYIFIFSLTLAIVFLVSGIGIKILNEIYKKAIEYKEENDFTI